MSGHSKWSTIKRAKAASDSVRGRVFTRLSKEIIVAARLGGEPDSNFKLRLAVQRAKDANMPSENIERAIRRGSGLGGEQDQMREVMYEGYGPSGIAILLQTLTDNRNRTTSDVRAALSKSGGNLAQAGAVAWQFEATGVIAAAAGPDEAEELALAAIDAGASDFVTYDAVLEVYCPLDALEQVRSALDQRGAAIESSEVSMRPKVTVALGDKAAVQIMRLLDKLEELEDVQRVFSNADFSDSALEQYREGA